jgi:DNA helicase-2/ATP-dependent DNA helicase PcrA
MIDYEKDLNSEQLEVVMAEGGPMLVIAGAGSGKTRALTYRVANLIESGVKPGRILLATFTNKAANSMLSRARSLVGINIDELRGGTFHHLGNRILRRHADLLGYKRNYTIMDSHDSKQLLTACIADAGIARDNSFVKASIIGNIVGISANTNRSIDCIVDARYPYLSSFLSDITKVSLLYGIRKKELNLMDFDDLLLNWRELLLDFQEIRDEYSERFLHVLVDEYQDTNVVQAEILDLLASHHRNIMVVGDDSQSIYSFRGADFTNIMRFPEKYPDARMFKLETNYRSTPEILRLANMSIVNNAKQFQKELRAVRGEGVRPVFVPLQDVNRQAEFIVRCISEAIDEGMAPAEIAVLYRAHYHSMELQMELVRRGIPFEVRSGIRFFEQAHIKDVTAFMRILVNPFDEPAWKRALCLYGRIGPATADKVWNFVSGKSDPLSAVSSDEFVKCAGKAAMPGLIEFRRTVEGILNLPENSTPAETIGSIMGSWYKSYIKDKYEGAVSREEDLNQLANFSESFESMEDFLGDLALMTNMAEGGAADSFDKDADSKIVLSTIHQAKGLEWSVVFMVWCSEGKIPLSRVLKEPGGEDEERRLFYVATTRAKDRLYFCHPLVDYTKGIGARGKATAPSRFIKELAPSWADPGELPFDQLVLGLRY